MLIACYYSHRSHHSHYHYGTSSSSSSSRRSSEMSPPHAARRRPLPSPAAAAAAAARPAQTLALLLCLLQQVTSASSLLTHQQHTPATHHHHHQAGHEARPAAPPHQTFLREGAADNTLLLDSDQCTMAMERASGTLPKVLTKGTVWPGQREGHLEVHNTGSGARLTRGTRLTPGARPTAMVPVATWPSHEDRDPRVTHEERDPRVTHEERDPRVTHEERDPRVTHDELDSPAAGQLRRRSGHQSPMVHRRSLHGPLWTDKRTLFVQLVVVADRSMWRHYGSLPALHTRVRQIVNVANGFLNRLGVVVLLTEVQVWSDRDRFPVGSNLLRNLEALSKYREDLLGKDSSFANDNTALLTRVEQDQLVGKAYTRGMCDDRQSASVVQDVNQAAGVVGNILAHEMGHNLGMKHDEQAPGILGHPCSCSTGSCVMREVVSSYDPRLEWSSCSRDFLNNMLKTTALDCLKNVPTVALPGSSCGDGVVDLEAGEQCDCGPPDYCHNPCCLAHTCRLATNATCASGACCDTQTCQPRAVGSVCRQPLDECDLPEYCSGHSEYCPSDVSKSDGTPCRRGQGHCYSGECGSHEGRCQHVWGPGARVASPQCFSHQNKKGNDDGNCGNHPRADQLLACTPQSSLCGTLHCLPPSRQATRFHGHHFNQTEQVGGHSCSFIVAYTSYPSQDWLSPDGASCGQGKMCMDQRCVAVAPPAGDCEGGCSGRGVCNSRGHCHCHEGYAPPDCSRAGLGGSIDSGEMGDVIDHSQAITIVWVLLVSLLALFIVLCCVWGNVRGWWRRRGRATVSQVAPCCVSCLDSCCCPVMTKATHWVITVGSSRKKKRNTQREIRSVDPEGGPDDAMLCAVDVNIKQDSKTNTWGVADETLVTDVITVTPKNSPDLHRKVLLPSKSPVLHHKSVEILDRPKYFQSMSVDSGCVSDGDGYDDVSSTRSSLHMSMKSLISTLRRFGSTTSRNSPEKDNQRSKTLGSQKSMPLSRFVVDPLAGNRSSRQGTPPPGHMKPAFRRSITVDATSSAKVRRSGVPQPPPANLKPHKSENNLVNASKVTNNPFILSEKTKNNSSNSGAKGSRKSGGVPNHDPSDTKRGPANQPKKKPMVPFHKSLSPLKVSPPRDTPPPPPLRDSRGSNTRGPWKTNSVSPQHSKTASRRQSPVQTNGKPTQSFKANIHSRGGQEATAAIHTRDTEKKNVKEMTQKFETLN